MKAKLKYAMKMRVFWKSKAYHTSGYYYKFIINP